MENLRRPESYLRDVLPDNPESILDVGIGHSEIFDFGEWEKRKLKKKSCADIYIARKDVPSTWENLMCDDISLPFSDEEYDMVQCCEVIEYIPPEKWDKLINELCRVSKDLIYITASNHTKCTNTGKCEHENPFVEYKDFPSVEFFKHRGFHILFVSPQYIIVFKRKISIWNSHFYDMDHYVKSIGSAESVIDIGTGKKGVVAQDYYENNIHIKKGYACDVWVLKELPQIWQPLKMNALDLLNVLGPKSVDIVQAFGFLEHLEKSDGFEFLNIAEKIAKKAIIISAASYVHGPTADYKANTDGNPYHRYNSVWHWKEFENLGYKSNYEDMRKGLTFSEEVIAWKILEA